QMPPSSARTPARPVTAQCLVDWGLVGLSQRVRWCKWQRTNGALSEVDRDRPHLFPSASAVELDGLRGVGGVGRHRSVLLPSPRLGKHSSCVAPHTPLIRWPGL